MKAAEECVRVVVRLSTGPASIVELLSPEGDSLMRLVDPGLENLGAEIEDGLAKHDAQNARFLDYLFSYRPADPADRREAERLAAQLRSDDIETRTNASAALVKMGRPARLALGALDRRGLDAEARARIDGVLAALDRWHRRIEPAGLDHDIAYLSLLTDPRATDRLRRIGRPGPGLRWSADADGYERK